MKNQLTILPRQREIKHREERDRERERERERNRADNLNCHSRFLYYL